MRIINGLAAIGTCVLTGCASSPPEHLPQRPAGEAFRGIQAPPPGRARVYIFRPAFANVGQRDNPMLQIDGKEVVRLSAEGYTDVLVKPGTYLISVKPGMFESSAWSGTWRMTASADGVHFLAVWNQADVKDTMTAVMVPGTFIFLITPVSESRNAGLRFEHVSQADALPVLSSLTFLPPLVAEFEPAP